jgi:hypothetical protein
MNEKNQSLCKECFRSLGGKGKYDRKIHLGRADRGPKLQKLRERLDNEIQKLEKSKNDK